MAVVAPNVAPVPEPKPTRQWDAWTREEEENFFGALRQVGKNFEKITSRVQSKNKDQVRHYYYRVIKRMNRILAPTLILDAKNSTHVNSAMLRWWSLLEKHSCSASKLRLKPRRYKNFVAALEHQLLKDHKKVKAKKPTPAAATSRRQAAHAETTALMSPGLPGLVPSGSGVTSADDSQNLQGVGAGRRTAVKRKAASNGPRKTLPKGEAKRPPRPRKKATDGNLSKAAYAKWEKAASVGVSLVAEAAEQLERANAAEVLPPASEACEISSATSTGGDLINLDVQTGQISPDTSGAFSELGLSERVANELPFGPPAETLGLGGTPVSSGLTGVPGTFQVASTSAAMSMPSPASKGVLPNVHAGGPGGLVIIPELCAQVTAKSQALDTTRCNNCSSLRCNGVEEGANGTTGVKLKLQLFPFDDITRKALEQDGHNPHLELTLKARKSISSVLHHLVQKWGRSTIASGDLRLFPFSTQWSNVSACQSWSLQDLNVSAADVHAALGSPAVFRLRYAWLAGRLFESSAAVQQQQQMPATNEQGPDPLEGTCYPSTRTETTTQRKSVQLPSSISPSVSITGSLIEQFRPSAQVRSRPESERPSRINGATRSVHRAVPANTDVQCSAPSDESRRRPVKESQHSVVGESNGAPAVNVGLRSGKEVLRPACDLASSASRGAETVRRSNCKELETASQVSGCAWLCQSNDGFAQQLWNYEDTVRSGGGVSTSQMDWVDSLTNISVSEFLGEASRGVFSAPSDIPHPSSSQAQLTGLDSFDMATAPQELPLPGPMLIPSTHPSAAIFGGEDTCDAFSFQRLDRRSKDTGNSFGEELSGNSLGLDITFADFRNMACWKEGDSLVALDLPQQPHFQSQDLLFDGEASIGLGGLIEALAQGSLDEFQACTISHDAEERDIIQTHRRGVEASGQTRASDAETRTESPSKEGTGGASSASFRDLAKIDELSNGNAVIGLFERLPEATLPNVSLPSQDLQSLKVRRPVDNKLSRKKERRSPQRPFKVPGQYTAARSLKLQG
ncbi:unnamed protein product [Calypogeia fissa]